MNLNERFSPDPLSLGPCDDMRNFNYMAGAPSAIGKCLVIDISSFLQPHIHLPPIILMRHQGLEYYRMVKAAIKEIQRWEVTGAKLDNPPPIVTKNLGTVSAQAQSTGVQIQFELEYGGGCCLALISIYSLKGWWLHYLYTRKHLENLVETLTPLLKFNNWLPKKKSGNGTSTLNKATQRKL